MRKRIDPSADHLYSVSAFDNMKNIHLIKLVKNFAPESSGEMLKDKEVFGLFDGAFRKLIEIRLRNGAVLSRHRAAEPITVFCISGSGIFKAGAGLEDELTHNRHFIDPRSRDRT